MLLTGLTVLIWAGSALNAPQSNQFHQYFPSHQHSYQNLRKNHINRSYHRGLSPSDRRSQRNVHFSPQSSQHLNSRHHPHQSYRQQRRFPNPNIGSYKRKPIFIQPSHEVPLDARNDRRHNQVPAFNYRGTRKIEQTALKTNKNSFYSNKGTNKVKSFLIKKQKKPRIDNVPIESAAVSTKVKVPPPSEPKTSGHKAKPQTIKRAQKTGKPVVKVADERNYNSAPPAPRFIIKQAGPSQTWGWAGHGQYAPLNIHNIFKAAGINTRWTPGIDPVFTTGLLYPSPPGPSPAPVKQTHVVSSYVSPSNKVKKSIPNSEYKPNKESKEPSFQSTSQVYSELPALPPAYVGPSSVDPPAFPPPYAEPEQPALPPPYVGPKVVEPSSFTYESQTAPAASDVKQQITSRPTAKPITSRPPVKPTTSRPQVRGSPTPSPGYIRPTTYKPSFVSSTSKPFSLVIDSSKNPKNSENDEEVFYIFYENDKKPLEPIKTGIDLQKYIEEEIENAKKQTQTQSQEPERNKRKQTEDSVYFDVPIKIEENGEGFTPPTEIRTIYVPQDKSESLPEIFDVDVGTSFGYNKLKKSGFPSFTPEDRYSYNNPITSYDAPIAPSSKKLKSEEKKSSKKIRKVKKEKVTNNGYPTSISEQYGARLGPKKVYDIIKK